MFIQSFVRGQAVGFVPYADADATARYLARKATFNDLGMDETSLQQMARSGFRFNDANIVVCEGNECGLKLRFNASGTPNEQSVIPMDVSLSEMKIKHVAQINKMHASSCQYSESKCSHVNYEQPLVLYDSEDNIKPIYNLSQSQGRFYSLSLYDTHASRNVFLTHHSVDGLFYDVNKKSLDCYYCGDSLPDVVAVSDEIFKNFLTKHKESVRTDSCHHRPADPSSAGAHSSPPPPPAPGQPGVAQSTPGQAQRSREPGTVQPSTPAAHQNPSPQAQTLPAQTPHVPLPQAHRQSYQTAVSGQSHEQVVNPFAQLSINNRESNTPGINNTSLPKNPAYASEQARIDSFSADRGWSSDKSLTPQNMAEAGFFFTGFEDNIRCFHCNGGLKNWGNGGNPFIEHARWFPQCSYIKQKKGQPFIDDVQALVRRQAGGNAPINQTARVSNQVPVASNAAINQTARASNQVPVASNAPINQTQQASSDVSNAWENTPAVSALKEMGYSLDQIRPAYDLVRSRKHKVDAQSLMEEILNFEDDANERHSVEEPAGREIVQAGENDKLPQEAVTERNSVSTARAGEPIAAQQHSGHRTPKPEERNSASGGEWSAAEITALEKENERLKEERLCIICLDQDAVITFLPCGHLCACAQCAISVDKCPICRKIIVETVRTYLS